jgi:hypothetical protein
MTKLTVALALMLTGTAMAAAVANADEFCPPPKFIVAADNSCQPAGTARHTIPKPKQGTVTSPAPTPKMASKTDILGITLGMPEAEVTEWAQRKVTCSANFFGKCFITENGELKIDVTYRLEPKVVKKVIYKFKSGLTPSDMIPYVSNEYGITPIKTNWSQELKAATTPQLRCTSGGFLSNSEMCYDVLQGLVAKWNLGNENELELRIDSIDSQGKSPDDYELILTSEKLNRAEQQASDQRDQEAAEKARTVNAKPKF